MPILTSVVGVKIADRLKPVPLMAPKEPPKTVKSPAVPFQTKLVPGSSENIKVMTAVWPALSAATLEVMVTVGARVSIVIEGEVPAEPVLPAASE